SEDSKRSVLTERRPTPVKQCCPQERASLEQLKQKFEHWLMNSKVELFAIVLPKKPDGKCGMTIVDRPTTIVGGETKAEWNGDDDIEPAKINSINRPRVVLGRTARIGEIPWMVSIYYREQFVCGGSII